MLFDDANDDGDRAVELGVGEDDRVSTRRTITVEKFESSVNEASMRSSRALRMK